AGEPHLRQVASRSRSARLLPAPAAGRRLLGAFRLQYLSITRSGRDYPASDGYEPAQPHGPPLGTFAPHGERVVAAADPPARPRPAGPRCRGAARRFRDPPTAA